MAEKDKQFFERNLDICLKLVSTLVITTGIFISISFGLFNMTFNIYSSATDILISNSTNLTQGNIASEIQKYTEPFNYIGFSLMFFVMFMVISIFSFLISSAFCYEGLNSKEKEKFKINLYRKIIRGLNAFGFATLILAVLILPLLIYISLQII